MDATTRGLLVQLPPATELVCVAQSPTHRMEMPAMAPGIAFTVIVFVVVQPVTE